MSQNLKLLLALCLVVLATVGFLDASYISYKEVTGQIPPCSAQFQCETVLLSSWSKIGPVPLAFFGVGYYSLVLSVAVAGVLGLTTFSVGGAKFRQRDVMFGLSWWGALFSAYLMIVMALILQAWCLYCLISATVCGLIAIVAAVQWLVSKETDGLPSPRRALMAVAYRYILKPIFFQLDPELVHIQMTRVGAWLGRSNFTREVLSWWCRFDHPSLAKKIDGIWFPNPIGLGAGFDYEAQLPPILGAVGFGFGTVGTVTYLPSEGNAKPRLSRLPRSQALLVNKGFRNPGAVAVIKKLVGQSFEVPVGISIGSTNTIFKKPSDQISDIVESFKLWQKSRVKFAYYELNISCPNTQGGQPFTDSARFQKLLLALTPLKIHKPVYVKMPIDLSETEVKALLKTAAKHQWIKGVIFGNLTKDKNNPAVHPADRRLWKKAAGNISGKPTADRSTKLIAFTRQNFGARFTIIGMGGIFTPEDALTKLAAGADLLQLITGMIYQGPQLMASINERLVAVQR